MDTVPAVIISTSCYLRQVYKRDERDAGSICARFSWIKAERSEGESLVGGLVVVALRYSAQVLDILLFFVELARYPASVRIGDLGWE